MIENMQELIEDEAMAYFRADVCLGSPESFSLDEKREICEQMESTSKAIEDAMKADFESLGDADIFLYQAYIASPSLRLLPAIVS